MQVLLFVMLGLLVFPKQLPSVAYEGILVAIFITFIARPIAVFSILSFFKVPFKDMLLISWAGLRGAASMVFAIFPLMAGLSVGTRIFNIVFFIAVLSILIQGGLLPIIAKKLQLTISYNDTVNLENFSRYIDEMQDSLMDVEVLKNAFAINKNLKELKMPESIRIIRIKRKHKLISPNGNTKIHVGDRLLIIVHDLDGITKVRHLFEEGCP